MSLATERRAARERALGLLYEAETKGASGAEVLASLPVAADDFTVALVLAVDAHKPRIDDLVERFAKDWSLARMPALDRAALRMGAAELIVRGDVPTAVVLAETVELASRFSTDASGRFVNGLLARIAEEVRTTSAPGDDMPDGVDSGMPAVDAVIFDLDGVIRHWDEQHPLAAELRLGLPEGSLSAAALDPARLERVLDGRLPFEGWCSEVGAELAAAHGVAAQDIADAWATATWQIDLAVIEMIRAVRASVPVALLSNASSHLRVDLELCGIADEFDAVIGSAELGAAKPDPVAFRAALGALGAAASRTLFVDDMVHNVEGARALGIRAEQFVGVDELRRLLESLELLA
ncbi:MAG: transcription antitermination factor NusB [Microthrixaceae bacterium]